jgi:hypothetical protein
MHGVRVVCGFAALAAGVGCSRHNDQSAPVAAAPQEQVCPPIQSTTKEAQRGAASEAEMGPPIAPPMLAPSVTTQADVNSHQLVVATIDCVVGPSLSNESSSSTSGAGSSRADSTPARCDYVARAVNADSASISRGDPAAIVSVRKAVERRLSTEKASSDTSINSLALFDKGVAAAKEARAAQDALSSGDDRVRAHTALDDLYRFGRMHDSTPVAAEAQAIAWVIATDRFLDVASLPTAQKSLAAEPLFTGILMVHPPAPKAGYEAAAWRNYAASAARAAGSRTHASGKAVGGGPADEKANLHAIARGAEKRLEALEQQLPTVSVVHIEVDRALSNLKDFPRKPSPGAEHANPAR